MKETRFTESKLCTVHAESTHWNLWAFTLPLWVYVLVGFCPMGFCPMGFCPDTVPDRCGSRRERTVANGSTSGAWSDQRWRTRRTKTPTCVEVWDALQFWLEMG